MSLLLSACCAALSRAQHVAQPAADRADSVACCMHSACMTEAHAQQPPVCSQAVPKSAVQAVQGRDIQSLQLHAAARQKSQGPGTQAAKDVPACMEDMPRSRRIPSATFSGVCCRDSSIKIGRSAKVPCSSAGTRQLEVPYDMHLVPPHRQGYADHASAIICCEAQLCMLALFTVRRKGRLACICLISSGGSRSAAAARRACSAMLCATGSLSMPSRVFISGCAWRIAAE